MVLVEPPRGRITPASTTQGPRRGRLDHRIAGHVQARVDPDDPPGPGRGRSKTSVLGPSSPSGGPPWRSGLDGQDSVGAALNLLSGDEARAFDGVSGSVDLPARPVGAVFQGDAQLASFLRISSAIAKFFSFRTRVRSSTSRSRSGPVSCPGRLGPGPGAGEEAEDLGQLLEDDHAGPEGQEHPVVVADPVCRAWASRRTGSGPGPARKARPRPRRC